MSCKSELHATAPDLDAERCAEADLLEREPVEEQTARGGREREGKQEKYEQPEVAAELEDGEELEESEGTEAGDELFEHFSVTADKGQGMIRLDKFLAVRLENTSRNRIQTAADAGNILVNGRPAKSSYKGKPRDQISIVLPYPPRELEIVAEDIPLNIVYEDDDLIVVNKEAGMVVHPGHGNYTGTLVNALTFHLQGLPLFEQGDMRAGLVHRIDKNTSGLLVVAKNERAHAFLARQFYDHTIRRIYHALVWGNFEQDEGTIVGNIARSTTDRLRMAVYPPDGPIGKHAVTHYRVLERFGYVTLVECRLETGRTHQIRVHMTYLGHPLVGDFLYGTESSLISRPALHSARLAFLHPITGMRLEFTQPIPQDMERLLASPSTESSR